MINEDNLTKLFDKYGIENVSCVHRHRYPSHKSCFVKGLIKVKLNGKYLNTKDIEKTLDIPWYKASGVRVGYFDIETDNLFADFGTVLSWVVKEKGGEYSFDVITKDELFDEQFDKRLIETVITELSKYDIIVGYNSTNFDLPFLRAKAYHYGLPFLNYGQLYHWDLYYTVKSKLRLSRKSLDNACDYLGIVGKTPIDKDVWRRAKYGNEEALDKVLEHNIGDCIILEELHDVLEGTRKWIKKSI